MTFTVALQCSTLITASAVVITTCSLRLTGQIFLRGGAEPSLPEKFLDNARKNCYADHFYPAPLHTSDYPLFIHRCCEVSELFSYSALLSRYFMSCNFMSSHLVRHFQFFMSCIFMSVTFSVPVRTTLCFKNKFTLLILAITNSDVDQF